MTEREANSFAKRKKADKRYEEYIRLTDLIDKTTHDIEDAKYGICQKYSPIDVYLRTYDDGVKHAADKIQSARNLVINFIEKDDESESALKSFADICMEYYMVHDTDLFLVDDNNKYCILKSRNDILKAVCAGINKMTDDIAALHNLEQGLKTYKAELEAL